MKRKNIKILSMLFSVLLLIGMVAPAVGAISTSNFNSNFYRHAAFNGDGVQQHTVGSDNTIVYCLQRGVETGGSISQTWDGKTSIQNTPFWKNVATRKGDTPANRTLIHGYPNYTGSYGLSGVDTDEKAYATQILLWEFVDGDRGPNDFSAGPKGNYANAFKVQSGTNGASRFIAMTESGGIFSDAYAYYQKLLSAVKGHQNTPVYNGKMMKFTKTGTTVLTDPLFAEFKMVSSDTSIATVSQSGSKLTVNVKKAGQTVRIYGEKTIAAAKISTPVMMQSGTGNQILMYGHLEDPVNSVFLVAAEATNGGIGVLKVSSNGKPVNGAKFGVYSTSANANADASRIATITTNSTGYGYYGGQSPANFTLKPDAVYYLKELADTNGKPYGNENLTLDKKVRSVTVVANQLRLVAGGVTNVVSYVVYGSEQNLDYGSLLVHTQTNGKDAGGFKFELYKTAANAAAGTSKITTITTPTGGDTPGISNYYGGGKTFATSKLAKGWYYLKMVDAPDGVTMPGTVTPVYVYPNMESRAYVRTDADGNGGIVDENCGSIGVRKTDANGNPLLGAKFGVYSSQAAATEGLETGTDYVTTLTTNRAGVAYYGGYNTTNFTLVPGTVYYVRELVAPEGCVLDPTVRSVTVVSNAVEFVSPVLTRVTYFDYSNLSAANRLRIAVSGEDYANKKSGVKFNIYPTYEDALAGTNAETNVTTDSTGEGYTDALGVGVHYIKMSARGTFNKLENSVYTIRVLKNTTTKLYLRENSAIINEKAGALNIVKSSSDAVVSGWEFLVTSSDTGYNKLVYTNEEGIVSLTNLPLKDDGSSAAYTVKETLNRKVGDVVTDCSTSYKCSSPITVTKSISAASSTTPIVFNFTNVQLGSSIIKKVDNLGNPLAGAGFTVYSDSACTAKVLVTALTNKAGIVNIDTSLLTLNTTYYVKETTVPTGYIKDNSVKSFKFTSTDIALEFTNTRLNYVEINKVYTIDDSIHTLANVQFGVYDSMANATADTNKLATITTNASGKAIYGKNSDGTGSLVPGKTYYFRELSVGGATYINFNGTDTTANIFSVVVSDSSYPTTYLKENFVNSAFRVLKIDSRTGNPLANAEIALYKTLSDAQKQINIVTTYTTGVSGYAYFGTTANTTDYKQFTLPEGTYYVREKTAPAGYSISNKIVTVTTTAGTLTTMNAETDRIEDVPFGGLQVAKVDNFGNPVAGCVFEVAKNENFSDAVSLTATDDKGFAYYGHNGTNFTLVPGTVYYVREASCPAGYVKSTEVQEVTIVPGDYVITEEFVNTVRGALKINKSCVDGGGNWSFTIAGVKDTATEGVRLTGTTTVDAEDNTKGSVLFENLIPGQYTVTETANGLYIPVVVPEQTVVSNETVEVNVVNTPKTGELEIVKTISEGSLAGWKFQVTRVVDGKTVYNQTFTTDATGKITVTGLRIGEYTVKEVDSGKKGYYCNSTNPQKVTVTWNDGSDEYAPAKASFENILRKYTIYKVDMYGYKMKGVEFGVYASKEDAINDTNRVKTLVTDEKGIATFSGFDNLHYYIKEVKTYDGYQIDKTIYELDNSTGNWRNSNKPNETVINYYTPIHTGVGSIGEGLALATTLGLIALVGFVMIKKRKKQES